MVLSSLIYEVRQSRGLNFYNLEANKEEVIWIKERETSVQCQTPRETAYENFPQKYLYVVLVNFLG